MNLSQQTAVLREQEAHEERVAEEGHEQPRVITLSDDSLVMLEGELCRWGYLTLADKKAYINGGYPF